MTEQSARTSRGQLMLSDADLQVIRSKSWGDALLTLLTNREFHFLKRESEACKYLTSHCGLCGLYTRRSEYIIDGKMEAFKIK